MRHLRICLLDFVLVPPLATALAVYFYSVLDHYHSIGYFSDLWTVTVFYWEGM